MNPLNSQIGKLIARFYQENISEKIPARKMPGVTYAIYTNYASDEHGDYDYVYGEAVENIAHVPEGLTAIILPAGRYIKLTLGPGKMPEIVINGWQAIWQMQEKELSGKRIYQADYEVYDQRAADPNHSIVDVFLGLD
jgi:predicted transcriptional regulator YdeE